MGSHFNRGFFQLGVLVSASAILSFFGVGVTWGGVSGLSLLAFGFGFTYLMATGFIAFRASDVVMHFRRFSIITCLPKTISILVVIAVLIVQSSAIFGVYFNVVDSSGFESQQLIDLDRYLRKILRLQLIFTPLFCAFEVARGRWLDFALAFLMVFFVVVFVLV